MNAYSKHLMFRCYTVSHIAFSTTTSCMGFGPITL